MGQPCVRAGKAFVAMPAHRTGALIVKLDEAKVDALVEAGRGRPFAPAGRVFREWIEITGDDAAEWKDLLDQAVALTRS